MKAQWPFRGKFKLGTLYGAKGTMWKCGWHCGLDLFSRSVGGDGRIYPIAEGIVARAGADGSYGNSVRVLHPDGYISLYAHFEQVLVRPGQTVTANTPLGIEGTTGNSTAVHLHLEIHNKTYKYPASTDPRIFIEARLEADNEEEENDMKIYKTLAEVPAWAKPAVEAALRANAEPGTSPTGKVLTGDGNGNLNLSESDLHNLTWLHRLGSFK